MNILIATQNQDKFQIIKGLLSKCGFSNCLFKNLSDVKIKFQSEEYGNLINRALMKAQYAYDIIDKNEQIDIFVGVDDGIKYKNNKTDEDSKKITEKILCQNFLSIGEIIIIVRAFAFLNKKGKIIDKFETEIPFKFIGNANNIQPQDMKYPLSHVLSIAEREKEREKSIIEMSDEESMNYYLSFCKKKIEESVNKIYEKINN